MLIEFLKRIFDQNYKEKCNFYKDIRKPDYPKKPSGIYNQFLEDTKKQIESKKGWIKKELPINIEESSAYLIGIEIDDFLHTIEFFFTPDSNIDVILYYLYSKVPVGIKTVGTEKWGIESNNMVIEYSFSFLYRS